MGEELEKLYQKTSSFGIDMRAAINELRAEITSSLPAAQSTDGAAIQRLVEDAEIRIGAKVAEVEQKSARLIEDVFNKLYAKIEAMKLAGNTGEPVDIKAIVDGVVKILQPALFDFCQKTSESLFMSNSKALMTEVYTQMDAKLKQQPVVEQEGQPRPSRIDAILGNDKLMDKLIDKFLGSTPAVASLQNDFNRLLSFHDLMTKIEKRTATSDDIAKTFANISSPAPAPPVPQQAPGK